MCFRLVYQNVPKNKKWQIWGASIFKRQKMANLGGFYLWDVAHWLMILATIKKIRIVSKKFVGGISCLFVARTREYKCFLFPNHSFFRRIWPYIFVPADTHSLKKYFEPWVSQKARAPFAKGTVFNNTTPLSPFDIYGPTVGALNAESTKRLFFKTPKTSWSRNERFSYGCAPSFACAKLYTFPIFSACALPPRPLKRPQN